MGPAVIKTVSPSEIEALVGSPFDCRGNGFRIGEPPRPGHPAGKVSAAGFHDRVTAPHQRCQVGLGGRVLPHVDVHGGSDQHRTGEGEVKSSEEIVGQAVRQFRHQVGRGRSDHEQFVLLRHGNVFDRVFDGEQVGEDFLTG